MNTSEKLQAVIEYAISKEWDVFGTECHQLEVFESTYEDREDEEHYYSDAPHDGLFLDVRRHGYWSANDILFNHEFAKAVWGEGRKLQFSEGEVHMQNEVWQYHLQQCVISDSPIDYYYNTIDSK